MTVNIEELNEQAMDTDFDSGYSSNREPTTTPEPDAGIPAEKIETPTPDAPKFAQITEAQLSELLAKATEVDVIKADSKRQLDNAFGQLGGLKQRIEQMQSATPAGEAIVLTDEDFEEITRDYPDFAVAQRNLMNKVVSKLKGTGSSFDPIAIERIVSEKVAGQTATFKQEIIDSSLEVVFPDWKREVQSEAFSKWMAGQSADVQALAASDSVGHAAQMLKLYEAAKNAPPKVAKPSIRQQQIAAAVTPKGIGGHIPAPSEDDDFNAGFNTQR